jgi:hypothetical protein
MGIGKRRTPEQRLAWNRMRSAQSEGADLREYRQVLERELANAERLRHRPRGWYTVRWGTQVMREHPRTQAK